MLAIETIPVVLKDLPPAIRGFCCLGSDNEPCIVLNSRLTQEQQHKTYVHELRHISSGEMYDETYVEYGA